MSPAKTTTATLLAYYASATMVAARDLSEYCPTAVEGFSAASVIPYETYTTFQDSTLSLSYCLITTTSVAPNQSADPELHGKDVETTRKDYSGHLESGCEAVSGVWETREAFKASDGLTSEEKYLCAVASQPVSATDKMGYLAVTTGVKPHDPTLMDVVRDASGDYKLGMSRFVESSVESSEEVAYHLMLTAAEVESILNIEKGHGFDFLQRKVSGLKASPEMTESSVEETSNRFVRIAIPDGVDDMDALAKVFEILSASDDSICDTTSESCKISIIAEGNSTTSGGTLSIGGAANVPALVASIISDDSAAKEFVQGAYIEPRMQKFNAPANWIVQSGNQTGHQPFHEHGIYGQDTVVGVGDSGLDYTSCFFADSARAVSFGSPFPIGQFISDARLYENAAHRKVVQYVGYAGTQEGENGGHGTHVSGSVAGKSEGTNAASNGLAPEAKLAFYDIGKPNSQYLNVPEDLYTLFFPYAKKMGAQLHTNSWGGNSNSYTSNARDVDKYSWEHQDFLVLVAAGNSGGDGNSGPFHPGSMGTPATAKNCLSVGASENGDEENDLAYFSSRGPAYDGRIKPDVVAPGHSVTSARSNAAATSSCALAGMSGTSMATPVTAGASALIQQYFKDGFYPKGKKTSGDGFTPMGALIKAVLINSGQKLTGSKANYQGSKYPNMDQGHGIVELDATLDFNDLPEDRSGQGLFVRGDFNKMPGFASASDPEVTYEFKSTGSECSGEGEPAKQLRATLVWHDYPGTTGTSKSLVNDLDITVVGSDNSVYYPNGGTGRDSVNNAESVIVPTPTSGVTYKVKVKANTISQGPQPYSLVVSGCFKSPDRSSGGFGGVDGETLKTIGMVVGGLVGAAVVGFAAFMLVAAINRRSRRPAVARGVPSKYAAKRPSATYGNTRSSAASRGSASGFIAATGFKQGGNTGAANKSYNNRAGSTSSYGGRNSGTGSATKVYGKVNKTFDNKNWGNLV